MKNILPTTFLLMIMSINILYSEPPLQTPFHNTPGDVTTVRGILGAFNPIEHIKGQLRLGYITAEETASSHTSAYALGGHIHFDSKRYYGWQLGVSAYGVLDLGFNQNDANKHLDFFDADNESFALLSELYLDGKFDTLELKAGRQILDTPHADSDDTRMIPNYFEAYTVRYAPVESFALYGGYIRQMGAGRTVSTVRNSSISPKYSELMKPTVFCLSTHTMKVSRISISMCGGIVSTKSPICFIRKRYTNTHSIDTEGLPPPYSSMPRKQSAKPFRGRKKVVRGV